MAKITYKFPADKFSAYLEIAKTESVTIVTKPGKPTKGGKQDSAPVIMGSVVVATISFRDPAYIGYMERAFAEYEKNKQLQPKKK